jgi:hypothetical protein
MKAATNLNRVICPSFNFSAGVDQQLDRSGVNMGSKESPGKS